MLQSRGTTNRRDYLTMPSKARKVGVGLAAGSLVVAGVAMATPASAEVDQQADYPIISITTDVTGADPVVAGEQTKFAITVANTQEWVTYPEATFVDRMQRGLEIVSIDAPSGVDCVQREASVRDFHCTAQKLLPTESFTVEVTAKVNEHVRPGTLQNCAGIAALREPDNPLWWGGFCNGIDDILRPEGKVAVDVINEATLGLTALPAPGYEQINPGEQGTLLVDVVNNGPSAATLPLTVTTTLPEGVNFRSTSGPWDCDGFGPAVECTWTEGRTKHYREHLLSAGEDAPQLGITFSTQVPGTAPSFDVTAAVSSASDDVAALSTDTVVTTFGVSPVDLVMAKSAKGSFQLNQQGTWVLDITNVGPIADAGDLTVTDTLPAGSGVVSVTAPNWTCSTAGLQVTCTREALKVGAFESGASERIEVLTNVGVAAASFTNTAAVKTTSHESKTANNIASGTVDATMVDLSVSETVTGPVIIGNNATWNIDVSNVGGSDDSGTITLKDTVPAHATMVTMGAPGWNCAVTGQDLSCTKQGLKAGATDRITLVTTITGGFPRIGNGVEVSTTSMENNHSNNSTKAMLKVQKKAQTAKPLPKSYKKVLSVDITKDGQKLKTRVICKAVKPAAAGDASYCKVTKKGKYLKIRVFGDKPMKVKVIKYARGTDTLKAFTQTKTYVVKP